MQTLRDIGNGEWGELVVGSRALSPVLHSNLYIPSTTKTQMNFALFFVLGQIWAVRTAQKISAILLKHPNFERSFFHIFMDKTLQN